NGLTASRTTDLGERPHPIFPHAPASPKGTRKLKRTRRRCIWSDTAWAGSSPRRPSPAVVITLGSPFGGSPWAHLLPFGPIIPELREGSPLLRRLASAPIPDGVRWLAFTATLDIIVPGVRSVPPHPQVETITVG